MPPLSRLAEPPWYGTDGDVAGLRGGIERPSDSFPKVERRRTGDFVLTVGGAGGGT